MCQASVFVTVKYETACRVPTRLPHGMYFIARPFSSWNNTTRFVCKSIRCLPSTILGAFLHHCRRRCICRCGFSLLSRRWLGYWYNSCGGGYRVVVWMGREEEEDRLAEVAARSGIFMHFMKSHSRRSSTHPRSLEIECPAFWPGSEISSYNGVVVYLIR